MGSVCVHVNAVKHVNKKELKNIVLILILLLFSLSLNTSNVQRAVETGQLLLFYQEYVLC